MTDHLDPDLDNDAPFAALAHAMNTVNANGTTTVDQLAPNDFVTIPSSTLRPVQLLHDSSHNFQPEQPLLLVGKIVSGTLLEVQPLPGSEWVALHVLSYTRASTERHRTILTHKSHPALSINVARVFATERSPR